MPLPAFLNKARPPSPLAGRLSIQSILWAIGDGTFMTSSAVFFTQIVGLSAAQVGLGITIAGIVSFLLAVPAGKLADRIGPQRIWALGAAGTATMYAVWPFISGFWAFLAMSIVLETVNSAGGAGRGAYILGIFSREERVKSQAYMYSALNAGFTVGAALGGIALAFDNDAVIRALPLVATALIGFNAYWITRLPKARHAAVPDPLDKEETPNGPKTSQAPGAIKNRGYLALSFICGVLSTNQVLLNVVIPLWLVEATDAPRVLLAWLFATNTVMCIFLPMAAAKGVRDVKTAVRRAWLSTGFFVLSCLITLITHDTSGLLTIALVWLGHVTVTGAELMLTPADWAFQSELSDPDRRGEYQGVGHLGGTLGFVGAPALYTFLAMNWGASGWLIIGGIVVVATLGLSPATKSAERFMVRYHLNAAK